MPAGTSPARADAVQERVEALQAASYSPASRDVILDRHRVDDVHPAAAGDVEERDALRPRDNGRCHPRGGRPGR